jgi:hypothetical protein
MLSLPAPKSEAPSSGPFAVFKTAVPASKTDSKGNSFAESMERARVTPGPVPGKALPATVPMEASSDAGGINDEGLLLEPRMVGQTPLLIGQKPQRPSTKAMADQASQTAGDARFQSAKTSEVQDNEEEPNAVPCHKTGSGDSQVPSLDAVCSILMLSVVAPVAVEPSPRLPEAGNGERFQPSSESNSNEPLASAVEPGPASLNPVPAPVSKVVSAANVLSAFNPLAGKGSEPVLPEVAEPIPPVPQPTAALGESPPPQPSSDAEPPMASSFRVGMEVAGDKTLQKVPPFGMGSAKKEPQMKKTAENSKMSPLGDLGLPSTATLAAGAAVSAVFVASRAKEPNFQDFDKVGAVSGFNQAAIEAPELLPAESISPAALKTVEKIEQTILHSVVELKRLSSESMSVVLRPDHQTELHLTLAVNQGRVEVEARLSRGDMAHLQAEWGILQQNLAQQGIRLQPLAQSQEFPQQGEGNPGGSSHFQRQDSGESNRRKTMLEEEMASSQFTFQARTEAARRLWETWA